MSKNNKIIKNQSKKMKEKISKCEGNCSNCTMCSINQGKNRIIGIKTVLIILLGVLLLSALLMPVKSHMQGASEPHEFELKPIILIDNGNEIEITLDNIKDYHGDLCPGVVTVFRQTQIGIKQLWGGDIPERDDIKIVSHFKNAEAPVIKGKSMKGRYDTFVYILNNTDNLEIRDCEGGVDCFKTTIIRKSTNEEFNITLKDNVSPDGFFELMKKVKITKNASDDEKEEFKTKWEEFRDNVLTKTNHDLFEYEIKKKKPETFSVTNAIFGGIIVIILILILLVIVKKFKSI